jgi:FkbM family methyltransferase
MQTIPSKTKSTKTRNNYINSPLSIRFELQILFGYKKQIVIFDVGSCEGEESIRYSRLFPDANIYAFEPLPNNVDMIKFQLDQYHVENVRFFQIALADHIGEADFYVSSGQKYEHVSNEDWDFGNKSSSLLPPHANNQEFFPWLKFSEKIKVPLSTIEVICDQNKIEEIDFIHLDVQGAELKVLRGAGPYLKKINTIWMEVENIPLYEGQPLKLEVETYMKGHGFLKLKDTVSSLAGDQLYVNSAYLRRHPIVAVKLLWTLLLKNL